MRAIDEALVHELVRAQFPEWQRLPIQRVASDGWDNRSFRLGDEMVVRLPSAACYAAQVEKEHRWLPVLARSLTCPIPVPLAMGAPANGYPWHWSVYRWLEGDTVLPSVAAGSVALATDVAEFLLKLQRIDPAGGPSPGAHNFHRGGPLSIYDAEVREAVRLLESRIDTDAVIEMWDAALHTSWAGPRTWLHGDMSPGNLLSANGRLSGVLDFGGMGVGDPACDLAIGWSVFRGEAREAFRAGLELDPATWVRGRAWALWRGLIVAAGLSETNALEWADPLGTLDAILGENVSSPEAVRR